MRDYTAEIATLIKNGENIVFYTLGSPTIEYVRELKSKYNLKPDIICDKDINKQGKKYNCIDMIDIVSPDNAIKKYPNGYIFIPSLEYKYEIIDTLINHYNIKAEKIINYIPIEKIKSCKFLQKALIYNKNNRTCFCWRPDAPSICNQDYFNIDELEELRNKLIDSIDNNKQIAKTACNNCPQIAINFYPKKAASWSVNYFCASKCNYKCSYCSLNHSNHEEDTGKLNLNEFITSLKIKNLLADDYNIILSTAGEPMLHPHINDFLNIPDYSELIINTNGSIFNEELLKIMDEKKIQLICSIDAGTPQTYSKIKNVSDKFFNKVKDNLSKYSKAKVGIIALKYIFLPGVNDDQENIDGFIKFAKDTNVSHIIIALDIFEYSDLPTSTITAIKYLCNKLQENNILYMPYTSWETSEYTNVIKELVI